MAFFTETHRDRDSQARCGRLVLPQGDGDLIVNTPVFMPVGTRGSVKALWQEDLEELDYRLILSNTYHLKMRPGDELIEKLGGVKKFISWRGALLTDSGGFQAFSLADRIRFREGGIEFSSHLDGTPHLFTPQGVIDIQRRLGSDIMMVLDDCPSGDSDPERLRAALDRTHEWAEESIACYRRLVDSGGVDPDRQRLFGIIQGGVDLNLRSESADFIQSLPFPGIAVGGLSVGETRESFYLTLDHLSVRLDPARPRYLMGVGTIPDILEAVRSGFDMFDCVLPTRNARNGQVFSKTGKINLRNIQYRDREEPIDPTCDCRVCRRYSLAYLRHLFKSGEMLGPQMATYHNLYFLKHFMSQLAVAIRENRFQEFYQEWKKIPY